MEQRTTDEWTIGLVTGHQSNKQQGYRQCCRGLPSCNETSCPGCCFVPPRLELPSTSKGFAALALVEGLAAVGFMIAMLAKTETNNSAAASFYAGMGIWFMSCFVYFAFDAIFSENKFQLAAADAMSLMATGYVILKYLCDEEVCGLGPFWEGAKLAVLIAKGGCSVLYLVATPFVLDNFGYSLFLLVGTDSHLISRYTAYLQTWTLLRFDFMLNLALIAMYGFFYKDGFEQLRNFDDFIGLPAFFAISLAAVGAAVLQVFVGWLAMTRERGGLVAAVICLSAAQLGYVGWKLRCHLDDIDCDLDADISKAQAIAVGAASLLIKALLCWSCVTAFRGFGDGLKPLVFERHSFASKANLAEEIYGVGPHGEQSPS